LCAKGGDSHAAGFLDLLCTISSVVCINRFWVLVFIERWAGNKRREIKRRTVLKGHGNDFLEAVFFSVLRKLQLRRKSRNSTFKSWNAQFKTDLMPAEPKQPLTLFFVQLQWPGSRAINRSAAAATASSQPVLCLSSLNSHFRFSLCYNTEM